VPLQLKHKTDCL